MKKPSRKAISSRRTSRSASSQPPPDPSIPAGDDSSSTQHQFRDRDETTAHTTPQSIADTPLSLSAPEYSSRYSSRAASGPPSEASALTQDVGGLDIGADFSGFLLPPGGPLVSGWDPSTGFQTYFEPQGELAAILTPSTLAPDFTPRPFSFGADSAAVAGGSPVLGISSLSSPASQPAAVSAASLGDYTAASDMSLRAGMKRKAGSDTSLAAAGGPGSTTKRASFASTTSAAGSSLEAASRSGTMRVPQPTTQAPAAAAAAATTTTTSTTAAERPSPASQQEPESREGEPATAKAPDASKSAADPPSAAASRKIAEITARLSPVLPAGKVFPIRIGSELFQLSGASISSDAPSYFSHYFGEQLLQTGGKSSAVKTLYIDRDPATFRDIALHLQGYHIKPRDGAHYVRLFADAQFYSLPRLTQQLFKSEIFIQVGDRHFQIPREIFSSPGNLPNFFSLGFAHFFSTPNEAFPGLGDQTLLRPPSIQPPIVPNRSGDNFAELLRILQGYDVPIRDEHHRKELVRDARYFHLKGVEQKLLPFDISYNLLRDRGEIVMRLEDLRQSGISFLPDPDSPQPPGDLLSTSKPATPHSTHGADGPYGWIAYQRPFVDDEARELIIDIGGPSEATRLDIDGMRAIFHGPTKARVTSLFQVVANKLNVPSTVPLGLMLMQSGGGLAAQPVSPANSGVSGERVKIRVQDDADISLDGSTIEWAGGAGQGKQPLDELPEIKKWKDDAIFDDEAEWVLDRGLWRLRIETSDESGRTEVVMCAVKVEAHTEERCRNVRRRFLSLLN